MSEPTIESLVSYVRENGPTLIRDNGRTYEVKYLGTYLRDHEEDQS